MSYTAITRFSKIESIVNDQNTRQQKYNSHTLYSLLATLMGKTIITSYKRHISKMWLYGATSHQPKPLCFPNALTVFTGVLLHCSFSVRSYICRTFVMEFDSQLDQIPVPKYLVFLNRSLSINFLQDSLDPGI